MPGSPRFSRGRLDRMVTTLGLAAVLAVPVACHHRGENTSGDEAVETAGPTTLKVINQGFSDMTIYVVSSGGQRIRLGLATGTSTTSFVIPKSVVNGGATPVRFIANPIGGPGPSIGDEITISPGEQAEVTIPPA